MLPILFSDTGATSQDGSHSAIFRMQGPEGCDMVFEELKTGFKTCCSSSSSSTSTASSFLAPIPGVLPGVFKFMFSIPPVWRMLTFKSSLFSFPFPFPTSNINLARSRAILLTQPSSSSTASNKCSTFRLRRAKRNEAHF